MNQMIMTAKRARKIALRKNRVEVLLIDVLMEIRQAAEKGLTSYCFGFPLDELTNFVQVIALLTKLGYKCELSGHYSLKVDWSLEKNEDFWCWDCATHEYVCSRCFQREQLPLLECHNCGAHNTSIVYDMSALV